jgi:hypothetical protein
MLMRAPSSSSMKAFVNIYRKHDNMIYLCTQFETNPDMIMNHHTSSTRGSVAVFKFTVGKYVCGWRGGIYIQSANSATLVLSQYSGYSERHSRQRRSRVETARTRRSNEEK